MSEDTIERTLPQGTVFHTQPGELEESEAMSLHTTIRLLDNGAVILRQPASAVTLTPSQTRCLAALIGARS